MRAHEKRLERYPVQAWKTPVLAEQICTDMQKSATTAAVLQDEWLAEYRLDEQRRLLPDQQDKSDID